MIHEETAGGGCRAASFVHVRFQWVCSCLGALAWQDASGRLPEPVSGMGRSPSVSSGPDPALPRNFFFFCQQLLDLLELPAKLGFIPFFFPCPLPSPTRDPRIISFPRPCFEVVELSAPSDSGFFNCLACARRIVEGRHPPTHGKLKRSRKERGLPATQCLQQLRDHNIFK